MKLFFYFNLLILVLSCDDGDLQIETIDFDSTTIQNCETVSVETANVLFKLNASEALIVELPNGAITNEITSEPTQYDVTSSGTAKVTYRTFSDSVTNNYFCSEIPVTEPTVTEEIIAEDGEILITTVLNADGVTYEHTLSLSGISFVTSNDTRITNLAIDNFGTVTTVLTE